MISRRMTIGDFSRATRLSAKTLRFYHRSGILQPASIDPDNGYRWYGAEQIADAQIVRQLRALEVPVETIRQVLAATDVSVRSELVAQHLERLELQLEATRAAVVSLRGLLAPGPEDPRIELRSVPATPALVVRAVIDLADLSAWYSAAWTSLDTAASNAGVRSAGPRGGIWDTDLFLSERGEAVLFQPVLSLEGLPPSPAQVHGEVIPGADMAVLTHRGPDETMAQSYGILGAYVATHEISVEGPIRESYLHASTEDPPTAATEIGWPIFRTAR